jgi:RNA polymerase sigma-70 factor (ECF subfamily)
MAFVGDAGWGESFEPLAALREHFGFIPNLFQAQTAAPELIQAEVALLETVLLSSRRLTRIQKECILLTLAAVHGNGYCSAWHYQTLQLLGVPEDKLDKILEDHRAAGLQPVNTALLDFVLTISYDRAPAADEDVAALRASGLADDGTLEAVHVAALSDFLRTLADGLAVQPDFAAPGVQPLRKPRLREGKRTTLHLETAIPARLGGPLDALRSVLAGEAALRGYEKILVQLAVSLANNDANQASFCEGVLLSLHALPDANRLTETETALMDFGSTGRAEVLRQAGFGPAQMVEAVAAAAFAKLLNILYLGVGGGPPVELSGALQSLALRIASKKAHLLTPESRHINEIPDPDSECVAQIQAGKLDAFEELMNRHHRRVYRTLVGILGDPDEARDAMQDTFLKAFQHLDGFEGRSKFSTWLLSIASNAAIQRLRDRKPTESLDETGSDPEEVFRPRQLKAWDDNPEQLYSQTEMRRLIERGIMGLPAKYRVVLMLRDIEQLPVEEAAAAVALRIPAFKARLLRGRLMLREALAPHFVTKRSEGSAKGVPV